MIKHERLAYLLNRLMAEEATGEEHAEMLLLIQDPANEDFAKSEIFTAYQTARDPQDLVPEKKQQILEAIFQSDREHKLPAVVTGSFGWRRWAAAAVLVIGASITGFYLLRKSEPAPTLPVAQKTDIQAGGNKATLTLADGKVISLTDAGNGKIATEAGLVITKQADGQLLYQAVDKQGEAGGYNTITTPYGGKYRIVLQDGTSVILNSGTSITYPIAFSKDLRKVTLTGEAYFEIAKDESKPFVVNIPAHNNIQEQEIRVLGTHFNVSAYGDEQAAVTTLVEGSVKVALEKSHEEKLLRPGQQAIVKESISVSQANVDAAVAWTNDLFYFTDLPLKDMMRQLSRWYDVEIVYQGEVPQIGFWAQISRKKKLSEVLASIETTNSIHFRIEGRKLTVSQNDSQ